MMTHGRVDNYIDHYYYDDNYIGHYHHAHLLYLRTTRHILLKEAALERPLEPGPTDETAARMVESITIIDHYHYDDAW